VGKGTRGPGETREPGRESDPAALGTMQDAKGDRRPDDRPRTSGDAGPYLRGERHSRRLVVGGLMRRAPGAIDSALDAALRTLYSVLCTLSPSVGLTVPGRPQAWGLASSRAAMTCLTSCRRIPRSRTSRDAGPYPRGNLTLALTLALICILHRRTSGDAGPYLRGRGSPHTHVSPCPRAPTSRLCRDAQCPASQRSASIAARQPMPAAVMA